MKMESIASRGARKDFTDLYFILQSGRLTLNDALQAFHVKFGVRRPDLLHRLKALTYFEDAELEPEPMLLRKVPWEDRIASSRTRCGAAGRRSRREDA